MDPETRLEGCRPLGVLNLGRVGHSSCHRHCSSLGRESWCPVICCQPLREKCIMPALDHGSGLVGSQLAPLINRHCQRCRVDILIQTDPIASSLVRPSIRICAGGRSRLLGHAMANACSRRPWRENRRRRKTAGFCRQLHRLYTRRLQVCRRCQRSRRMCLWC